MKTSKQFLALILFIIFLNSLTVHAQNTLPASGNVGIGTSTPIYPFEVYSSEVNTDVQIDVDNSVYSPNYFPGSSWQSFTAGVTKNLVKVELYNASSGDFSGTLSIYAGSGTSGQLLHSQPYSTGSVGAGFVPFDLTSGIPLTKGQQYTVQLTQFNWQFTTSYEGGRCGWNANLDYGIKTYMSHTAVDQSNTGIGTGYPTNIDSWQSFTVSADGVLTRFDAFSYGNGDYSGTIYIYKGEGQSGELLHSQPYSSIHPGWNIFNMKKGIPVTKGEKYTARITNINWEIKPGYERGRAKQASWDFKFRSFLSTPSTDPTFTVGQERVAIGVNMDNNPSNYKLAVGGKVGIGTTNIPSDFLMAVDGKLICEEVKVQLSENWPDYVFESNYELMPLTEVADYIAVEKHLPGIPAAKDIDGKGVEMGEMQRKMMEKIEELTLYMIQQQNQIATQQKQIEALKGELNK